MRRFVACALLLAVAHADDTAFTVSGRVQDARHRDLAGVVVELRDGAVTVARGGAGADGSFAVAVSRERAQARIRPFAPVTVVASAKGYSPREREAHAGATGVALALPRAFEVRGVVTDESGGALSGVRVLADLAGPDGRYRAERVSAADGAFAFADAGKDLRTLEVLGPGASRTLARIPVSGKVTALIKLAGLMRFQGRLVTEKGKRPIAGGTIWGREAGIVAMSDRAGRFTLLIPPPPRQPQRRWPMSTLRQIGIVASGHAARFANVRPGEPFDVELSPTAPLAGTVVEGENRPVTGAELELWGWNMGMRRAFAGGEPLRARTGADGKFRFDAPPAGSKVVVIRAPGYLPRTRKMSDVSASLTFYLERGRMITGRVVDGDGNAAVGARIEQSVVVKKGHPEPRRPRCFADDSGAFTLFGLDPGRVRVYAARGGLRSAVVEFEMTERATAEAGELVLKDVLPLRGRVVDDVGVAIADAEVTCRVAHKEPRKTRTDDRGDFVFEGLPLGEYRLVVEPEHHTHVSEGAHAGDLVRLVAERVSGSAVLDLRFEAPADAEGEVNVWVVHTKRKSLWRREVVDLARPSVLFKDLVPGMYLVKMRYKKRPERTLTVRVTEDEPRVLTVRVR